MRFAHIVHIKSTFHKVNTVIEKINTFLKGGDNS